MPKDASNGSENIPHSRKEARPNFEANPPPSRKVPQSIQDTLDYEEKLWSLLYEGRAHESTDSNVRYAGYAVRVRTIMSSAHRYAAYTSEVGESFRPIAHPLLVRSAYAVSWAYIIGDVAYEGYKAYLRQTHSPAVTSNVLSSSLQKSDVSSQAAKSATHTATDVTNTSAPVSSSAPRISPLEDYRVVMTQRAIFQTIASMALPAFTVHSVVKYSGRVMKNSKNVKIRAWGPVGLGLAAVPFLPYLFDEPIEHLVEKTFYKGFEMYHGSEKMRELHGNAAKQRLIEEKMSSTDGKEKEL